MRCGYCKTIRHGLPLLIALVIMAAGPVSAGVYNLRAAPTKIRTADGTMVDAWGFGFANMSTSVPGPTLRFSAGESVTINVTNNLPVPVSLVIPGQRMVIPNPNPTPITGPPSGSNYDTVVPNVNIPHNQNFSLPTAKISSYATTPRVRSFTTEAAANGGTVSYSFTAKSGTYLYESGTNPAVQIPLGLYGAVVVGPTSGQAYPLTSTTKQTGQQISYNQDVVVLFSEIEARYDYNQKKFVTLNEDVIAAPTAPRSIIDYAPLYYLMNGKSYPDTIRPAANAAPGSIGSLPGIYAPYGAANGKTLLRFINAGVQNVVPTIQGSYMDNATPPVGHTIYPEIIAEDGNLYNYPKQEFAPILPAGKTLDAMLNLTQAAAPGYYTLYDRRLGVTNAGVFPGGMLTFLASWDPATQNCSPFKGDLNGDGRIDAADVLAALRLYVAIPPGYDPNADVTPLSSSGLPCGQGSGPIKIGDVMFLLRKAVGLNPY